MTAQGKVRIATVAARTRTTIVLPVAHEADGLIQTTVERRRR